MKKVLVLILFLGIFFIGCEKTSYDEYEEDWLLESQETGTSKESKNNLKKSNVPVFEPFKIKTKNEVKKTVLNIDGNKLTNIDKKEATNLNGNKLLSPDGI